MKNETFLYIIFGIVIFVIFIKRKMISELAKEALIMTVILKHEGGYVFDPDDPGGETKYGISKRSYPGLDIKNLTRDQAIQIYKKDYYLKMGIDKIQNLNLAVQVMDFGVNAGTGTALKYLYSATFESEKTGENIVKVYKRLRKQFYVNLSEKKPVLKKFLAGWLNRIETANIA